ncbi:MAG TPA: DEAD/DEAH box helicase [Chloroflexi bacterium]|nr:DEAD/DEAH box helicase [Chloroflexota bacterium]
MNSSIQPAGQSADQTFGPLPVGDDIARALHRMGYSQPTPIQEQAIPPLRNGLDVMGQAQTGTGKTAGFGVPIVEMIDLRARRVQAIVLVPTRELCLQVAEELSRLGSFASVRVVAVHGGVGFGRQLDALRQGAQIVVGTPGRVEDLMARGNLRLDGVRFAVLDEADRMLDVGFLPAIERILGRTPSTRQTALFSATIPDEVRRLASRHMHEPVTIAIESKKPTVEAIDQRFEDVRDGDKLKALIAHLDDPSCFLALVFRRTTYKADRLAHDLSKRGYKVAALHGRRTQPQREKVLADLKSAKLHALIATDIAARGLDIGGLTHVFNFDLPDTPETYVHRIGRTGRAGEAGTAITLIGPEDAEGLSTLKKYLARREAGDQRGSGIQEGRGKPRRSSQISDRSRSGSFQPSRPNRNRNRRQRPSQPLQARSA